MLLQSHRTLVRIKLNLQTAKGTWWEDLSAQRHKQLFFMSPPCSRIRPVASNIYFWDVQKEKKQQNKQSHSYKGPNEHASLYLGLWKTQQWTE